MKNDQHSLTEVETMLKRQRENELSLNEFATLPAIRGKQFGREVYSSLIHFKDLSKFLKVFPDVQRNINKNKVRKIKRYVISGLEEETALRFLPAITVTARGSMFYDEGRERVAIDIQASKLSTNDGQHRFFGVDAAIEELEEEYNKTKDQTIYNKLDRLKNMAVPLTIYNGIGDAEEAQLFHDTNNLAQRPSRSATIKLAQTDQFAKLAREVAVENRYLKQYGVEMDKSSLHKSNDNTFLLTTLYWCAKRLFWKDYKADSNLLTDKNYKNYKEKFSKTLDQVFQVLPSDINVKGKYLLDKHYALKGIFRFIHYCRYDLKIDDQFIFITIGNADWSHDIEKWRPYGATLSKRGQILFGDKGITAVSNYLTEILKQQAPKKVVKKIEELEVIEG